jgi:hypothetical protein
MKSRFYRYYPPTPYRPWAFVGYYTHHIITGAPQCLAWWLVSPEQEA